MVLFLAIIVSLFFFNDTFRRVTTPSTTIAPSFIPCEKVFSIKIWAERRRQKLTGFASRDYTGKGGDELSPRMDEFCLQSVRDQASSLGLFILRERSNKITATATPGN